MTRNICISAGDGNTAFTIAELILTDNNFKSKIDSLSVLSLHPESAKAKELQQMGAKIIPHHPGKQEELAQIMQESGCDTVCVIPPAHAKKVALTSELITATKKADIPNILFISSVGADLAER